MDPTETICCRICTRRMFRPVSTSRLIAGYRADIADLRAEISKEINNKTAALDSITARAIHLVEELEAENAKLRADLAAARS
jgi:hypothetical protein